MFWDNLVSTANQAKAKAYIHSNPHRDQKCLKKMLLKMKNPGQDGQTA